MMEGYILIRKNLDRMEKSGITGEEIPVHEVYTRKGKILVLKEPSKAGDICLKVEFDKENCCWDND